MTYLIKIRITFVAYIIRFLKRTVQQNTIECKRKSSPAHYDAIIMHNLLLLSSITFINIPWWNDDKTKKITINYCYDVKYVRCDIFFMNSYQFDIIYLLGYPVYMDTGRCNNNNTRYKKYYEYRVFLNHRFVKKYAFNLSDQGENVWGVKIHSKWRNLLTIREKLLHQN